MNMMTLEKLRSNKKRKEKSDEVVQKYIKYKVEESIKEDSRETAL